MKTLGLIGGMSWQSSALFYRLLNEETQRRLGGHSNAKSVMVTVDFAEVEQCQRLGQWDRLAAIVADAARTLERAGAECVVLCTNSVHMQADAIEAATRLPFLHIADAIGAAVRSDGHRRAGLLGTRFTMERDFYRNRLERAGLEVLIPAADTREALHRIIYDELTRGVFREESRERYREAIRELQGLGVTSVILGCTEIELLISAADSPVPIYPSTAIHVRAAVDFALTSR